MTSGSQISATVSQAFSALSEPLSRTELPKMTTIPPYFTVLTESPNWIPEFRKHIFNIPLKLPSCPHMEGGSRIDFTCLRPSCKDF